MPEFKPDRAPGVYRARFVKLDEGYTFSDRETGEEVVRWRWVFQETADPTTVGEMDTISSPGFRVRSNGLKFLTGMLGRAPKEGDHTDTLIGQEFDVTWGPNQGGRYTIVNVTRPVAAGGKSASAELAEQREGRTRAADAKAAQEGEVVEFRGAKVDVTDPRVQTPTTTPEGDGGTEDDQLPF